MTDLPAAFADLERFAAWSLPTESARAARRRAGPLDALRVFYDAMLPRLSDALSHLDTFPLDGMPPAEQKLMDLCLSFAEVAPYVEQYFRTTIPETFDEARFIYGHEQPGRAGP